MFAFIKKMFNELLSACATGSFGESLVPNLKRPIKCVQKKITHAKLDQHLLI